MWLAVLFTDEGTSPIQIHFYSMLNSVSSTDHGTQHGVVVCLHSTSLASNRCLLVLLHAAQCNNTAVLGQQCLGSSATVALLTNSRYHRCVGAFCFFIHSFEKGIFLWHAVPTQAQCASKRACWFAFAYRTGLWQHCTSAGWRWRDMYMYMHTFPNPQQRQP